MTITQEYLKQRLHYDSETGVFAWRALLGTTRGDRSFNMRFAGKRAGYVWTYKKSRTKYRSIHIFGKTLQEHRLAFLYMTGNFPSTGIDHIDGNGLNNSWTNLRQANQSQNKANGRLNLNNSTGFKGVSFYKKTNKYKAQIYVRRRNIHLGYFVTARQAAMAYRNAALKFFGEFARS